MKTIILIILIFIITVALSVYLFISPDNDEIDSIISKEPEWTIKEKEIINRLLNVPIMLYHDIDGHGPYSVSLNTLRIHFQMLKDNNIKVIPLSELIKRLEKPEPFAEKVVVITFDDGFLSAYTKLLPLVKEFGYPVTIFIYTDNIYTSARKNMTWKRLREMEKHGIVAECHSISHADLEAISKEDTPESRKVLFKELYLSRRIIELYMGKDIKYFAFPYGRYDLNLIEMCRYCGYERVFSTDYGSNIITRNNYCLRRSHIKRDFSLDFIKQTIK